MLNKIFKLQITFLGYFQKWSTEFLAFSWKIAQSSTWIVEDVAFHPFLSALVSIYSNNFLTLLQIILKKKNSIQGGFCEFGVLILQSFVLLVKETWQTCRIQWIINWTLREQNFQFEVVPVVVISCWSVSFACWKKPLKLDYSPECHIRWHGALQSESLCWHWKYPKTLGWARIILDKTCCLLSPELDLLFPETGLLIAETRFGSCLLQWLPLTQLISSCGMMFKGVPQFQVSRENP